MIATRMNHQLSARLLLAAALATAFPATPLWAQPSARGENGGDVRLPSLGESAGDDFSVGTERRRGEQIMAEIRRDPAYLDDALLLDHIQSMWLPLVAAARARGNISADRIRPSPGKPSSSATARSTPLRCPAVLSACTWG